MRQFTSLQVAILALGSLCFSSAYAGSTLVPMSDAELSATRGQALMSMSYIAPTDSANLEKLRDSSSNVGFFKLSLDADIELNTNIRKLQLGCGGANGAGACDIDIDIDNLSLSGLSNTNDGRASSSAKITNPFIEFAIKNPNSTALREVTGLRVSAEAIEGLLTFGTENSQTKNGINSLSGYMEVAQAGGTVKVNPVNGLRPADVNNTQISGEACGYLACVPFQTYDYTLNLTTDAAGTSTDKLTGTLFLPQQTITGKRISVAPLKATATVSGINVSGNIKAIAAGLLNLDKSVTGSINNLAVNVDISEDLGFFHKANLNGSPVSLSLQGNDIRWPGTKSVAERGWWLELSNPIDIGDITPAESVSIANKTIEETLALVSQKLSTGTRGNTKVDCGDLGLLSCIGGSTINIGNLNLAGATPVQMSLSNLVLKNQTFATNCHGADVKFC
ncbi:hypothetical protein [Acinetobacter baumannii]|uniref:hypothetical protein n=1 Tax=Acinetobacter baumannii TaxID=470 RepID=UPI000D68E579|nr:hypothetical protein [Acinetobacter baumannii]SSQ11248.1 Uncharacterised protein [Acinetobacter baumannii]